MDITIHPSAKKRGHTDQQIVGAWRSGEDRRCLLDDGDVPRELRLGFTAEGIELEVIGLIFTDDRVMIHHCMRPTNQSRRLIEQARRTRR